MKHIIFILFLGFSVNIYAQYLSIDELLSFFASPVKSNIFNEKLLEKHYIYLGEKIVVEQSFGLKYNHHFECWAYGLETNYAYDENNVGSNKIDTTALIWITRKYVDEYRFGTNVKEIFYQFSNNEEYSKYLRIIKQSGYKLVKTSKKDNSIITEYSSEKFNFVIESTTTSLQNTSFIFNITRKYKELKYFDK